MKVTDIKQQLKRQDRYSIFIDDKYVFSLSENELFRSAIKLGQEFSDEELQQLKQRAVVDKAHTRSLDLLARRARSEWEIREYLRRKEYDTNVIDHIVTRLKDQQYIDDEKFAETWIANRRTLKPTSNRKLAVELKQKRVSDSIISRVLADNYEGDTKALREIIEKKRKQTKYHDDMKLMQYLARQGFNYDDIKQVLQEFKP